MSYGRVLVASAIGLAAIGAPGRASARQPDIRVVIATNVACRAKPDTAAPVAVQYTLGDVFLPRDSAETGRGVWYLDTARIPSIYPGCWIHAALTTAWSDRERALLAAADRILAREDRPSLEDHVAVDNLLLRTPVRAHSDSTVLETSPLLQLRRLQVLEHAARAPGTSGWTVRRDPLRSAWFLAHRDVLRYHEPAGSWLVTAEVYWRLFERYRATEWAEEMAWAAARGAVPGDECDAACVLDRLRRTYARYWAEFPRGRWVDDALIQAERRAGSGARIRCVDARAQEVRRLADSIRASLADVAVPRKAQVVAHVNEIERACAGAAASFQYGRHERMVPGASRVPRASPACGRLVE